jgi:hypothetical protein
MKLFRFKKIVQWEYWPWYIFYIPLLPYAFYLALKSRSCGFFSAVNPGIEGSGNGLESKYETLQLLPKKYKPTSIFINKGETFEAILSNISCNNISYPLIIKPDIGYRGLLVKKINSEKELSSYIAKYNAINLIIQEWIQFKNECGIFYHRIPNEKKGKITSITLKKYLTVVGDGKASLFELIQNDERAINYITLISELNKDKLESIPGRNEEVILSFIGNHSKGTQFINGNHLINSDLSKLIDKVSKDIHGWFYGRIDVKYNNFEELLKGENFTIIELNGIISEPTHIYDSTQGSYFKALRSIKKHWGIVYDIGTKNKKLNNGKFTNLRYFINLCVRHKKYLETVKSLNIN